MLAASDVNTPPRHTCRYACWTTAVTSGKVRYLDAETAQWIAAEQVLAKLTPPEGDEFVITGCERVSETWVVHWNSRRSLDTEDFRMALGGNGPVLVSDTYEVAQASTFRSVAESVAEFEGRA